MSRTAWKTLPSASLAAAALLGGCQSPFFATLMGRPAERPAAVAAAPTPLPAAELPAGAGALGPPPWPEPSGLIYSAPALQPMPDPRPMVRSAHAVAAHTSPARQYARPARSLAPEPLQATRAEHPLPLPAAAPVRAQAQAARPLGDVPTLIAPVSPPPATLPDPPPARPPASTADAAKPASLAPAAPARPAALAPVHKAQPGADTTPY